MSGDPRLYDPVSNPYAPGAGTPPPALVGRDHVIEAADIGLRRVKSGRSAQHLLLTGLRGVGKTVLLGKLAAVAEHSGFRIIRHESVGGNDVVVALLRQARRLLTDLEHGPSVVRALRSIDSVSVSVAGTGIKVDRSAPPGDPESLSDAIVDIAKAAKEHDIGIMLAIDEAQMIDSADLRRLLAGIHRCGQDSLPLWCLLAGLPNLVGDVAKAATYAERLFTVTDLGPLSSDQVRDAVLKPSVDIGVTWADPAIEAIADESDGFPFFVQTWAYHTWNVAQDEPISVADVRRGSIAARQSLDASFFAARVSRIPQAEVAYVQAMASLGAGPHRSGDIAAVMGRTASSFSATRDRLINEGVVYAPRYGWVEFAIPHFDDYVRRTLQ